MDPDIDDRLAPPSSERRAWPRYIAEREVRLGIEVAGHMHDCLIKDISLGGARLSCGETLPDCLDIVLTDPELGPTAAKRLWRSADELGIEFDFSDESLTLISQCLKAMLHENSPQRSAHH